MRIYRRLFAALLVPLVILLSQAGIVSAQEGNCTYPHSIPVMRDVVLNVADRVDTKLNTWVTGDTLTAEGESFVADLADFIADLVSYIAECLGDILAWLNFI